jgi:hypothetical protein
VLLEPPFPDNLPVVAACTRCNQGFSLDEEYLACLIEVVVAGSTDPNLVGRPGVSRILRNSPELRARLEAARTLVADEGVGYTPEPLRIRNVVLKLARGHAAFELSQPCRDEPSSVWWAPLETLSSTQRHEFEASPPTGLFGEVGSRQSQRLLVIQATLLGTNGEEKIVDFSDNGWIDVQDDHYRYLAIEDGATITIRMVIREYLACQVIWAG